MSKPADKTNLGPFSTSKPAKGESMVWLSALGVAIGIMMVVGILSVIIWRGVGAFYPERIDLYELAPGAEAAVADSTQVGGEVAGTSTIRETIDGKREVHRERLVYVANREVYGKSFVWVDDANITATTQPPNAIRIERGDNPVGIGIPTRLELEGGETLPADDPEFDSRLAAEYQRALDLRDQIEEVERVEIGHVNKRIADFTFEIKQLQEASAEENAPKIAELQSLIEDENAHYEELAAEARALRARLASNTLVYNTLEGREQRLATGEIYHYYYPNRLSGLGRIGVMFQRMWAFVSENPRHSNTEGGIFPAIVGTFMMTLLMCIFVTPAGVIAAIYLHEYAKQGPLVRLVRVAINNLAGVPSIVFGVFGLGFFVYILGGHVDELLFDGRKTFGAGGMLWAALTLALLTVPVVIVATEEALSAVARGAREASLALGASKWQTIWHIVLPASAPGILTGMILSMARGAGEVAPLMLVGLLKSAKSLPVGATYPYVHLDQKFMHLGFHIYDLGFQSPDSQAAIPMVFATTLLLISLVVAMNLTGIVVRERLRRRYKTHTF